MNDRLQHDLIETVLAAEMLGLIELPAGFHGTDQQHRAEQAAYLLYCLDRRATAGERRVLDFWKHRKRVNALPVDESDLPRVGLYSPFLNLGGAERWIVDLAYHLDANRLNVVGLATGAPNLYPPLLLRAVARMPVYLGPDALEMLARSVDVLVYWGFGEFPPRGVGLLVYVSHGACACAKHWANPAARQTIHLTAVSEYAARPFPPGRHAEIIYNGVEVDRLKTDVPRETIRERWGLLPEEIAIGYVGRLSHEKNPTAAIMAAAELGSPYRAVYAGQYSQQMARLLDGWGTSPILIGATEKMGEVYRGLDCLVLASNVEGFSLALTEAWWCGLPTVATPVGAIPELEARFGHLTVRVPVHPSATELATAVQHALSSENRSVVERAQAVAREHFTAAAMGRRWTNYLCRILLEDAVEDGAE